MWVQRKREASLSRFQLFSYIEFLTVSKLSDDPCLILAYQSVRRDELIKHTSSLSLGESARQSVLVPIVLMHCIVDTI